MKRMAFFPPSFSPTRPVPGREAHQGKAITAALNLLCELYTSWVIPEAIEGTNLSVLDKFKSSGCEEHLWIVDCFANCQRSEMHVVPIAADCIQATTRFYRKAEDKPFRTLEVLFDNAGQFVGVSSTSSLD